MQKNQRLVKRSRQISRLQIYKTGQLIQRHTARPLIYIPSRTYPSTLQLPSNSITSHPIPALSAQLSGKAMMARQGSSRRGRRSLHYLVGQAVQALCVQLELGSSSRGTHTPAGSQCVFSPQSSQVLQTCAYCTWLGISGDAHTWATVRGHVTSSQPCRRELRDINIHRPNAIRVSRWLVRCSVDFYYTDIASIRMPTFIHASCNIPFQHR